MTWSRSTTTNKHNAKASYWCLNCAREMQKVGKKRPVCSEAGHKVFYFRSKKERDHWHELRIEQMAGIIRNLEVGPVYPIVVDGHKCGNMLLDFSYFRGDKLVVEDVKPARGADMNGARGQLFRLHCKLMLAIYGIHVEVV